MQFKTLNRGWSLTKSSWQLLRLDKELMAMPLLGILTSLGVIGTFALTIFGFFGSEILNFIHKTGQSNVSFNTPGWLNFVFLLTVYIVFTLISNFFSAALVFGASERFNGGDPTVKSSLRGARKRFSSIAKFSLLMATVGLALQTAIERLPFFGALAVRFVGAAWSVANIFAIPVIVLSDKEVQPLEATKQSISVIKKVWGEGIIVNSGIVIIGMLGVLTYVAIGVGATMLGAAAHLPVSVAAGAIFLLVLGLLALLLVLTTLGSITKVALYHYAVTGQAPKMFNSELLQATITQKKARRIFS